VSITTKLILPRQLLLQVRRLPRNKRDERRHEARQPYQRETPGRLGKFMPLISYDLSLGINKITKRKQQQQKLRQKIALLTSTTMTITVMVANTSRAATRASSAASDGKESANKSSDYWSASNYHLVILSKKEDGQCASQVPRK
jgi:hypothetical protein